MEKAILTGATGFLGRHIAECLDQNGVQVYAIFRNEKRRELLSPKTVCICDDLTDAGRLAKKLEQAGASAADVFYHTAWSGVAQKDKNSFEIQRLNLGYSKTALDASYLLGCGKFVDTGTVAEYVENDGLIRNDSKPTPSDVYGATKVAARYLLSACADNRGQPIVHAILSSIYGEYRMDGSVIPYTIEKLLRRETPSFGTLEQMWNFIYVKDAARALYLIGESGHSGKTYFVGTEDRRQLLDYNTEIRDRIDSSLPLCIGERKQLYTKVRSSCVDIKELQNDTGFVPKYTFSQGIENTIAWMREYLDLR